MIAVSVSDLAVGAVGHGVPHRFDRSLSSPAGGFDRTLPAEPDGNCRLDSCPSYTRASGSNGLQTFAPSRATSATLRVAKVNRCTLAVAASSASITDTDRVALMRPHSSLTDESIG